MNDSPVPHAGRALLIALALVATTACAAFRAGIALRVVTPDPLLPVSGGIGPSKPATHKEGDLTVRALVLSDGSTKIAIVSADFLGFPSVLGNKARAQVNPGRIDLWPQRGMRPNAAQPEGFGLCGALGARPKWVKTASLDPLWPHSDHPRPDSNEMPDICGTGHQGECCPNNKAASSSNLCGFVSETAGV